MPVKRFRPGKSEPTTATELAVSFEHSRAIGAILVDLQRLTPDEVDKVRFYALEHGLKFGEAALKLKLVKPRDVEIALARQFQWPKFSAAGSASVSDEIVGAHAPHSRAMEDLRTLRNRLDIEWLRGEGRKTLAIMSPDRGDGRSWLAANLAMTFAQIGQRTLLIDADMRQPRQHEIFRVPKVEGLAEVLTGRAGQSAIHRIHPQLRLFILPAGAEPPNPHELLARPMFDVLLQRLSDRFDIVIIDTPAAYHCSDAQLLATRARSCVLVARRDQTRLGNLREVVEMLEQSSVNIVGGVMNDNSGPAAWLGNRWRAAKATLRRSAKPAR